MGMQVQPLFGDVCRLLVLEAFDLPCGCGSKRCHPWGTTGGGRVYFSFYQAGCFGIHFFDPQPRVIPDELKWWISFSRKVFEKSHFQRKHGGTG